MNLAEMPPARRMGWISKLLIRIASADEATLRLSPPHDLEHVHATATLMICTCLYQAALFSIISHRLFAAQGQIRPELLLASVFVAVFILLIDSFCVIASQWHLSGIEEIRRGGIEVGGGTIARVKAAIFLIFRLLLSIALAQLTALFLSLLIFSADISASIQDAYLHANAHLVATATIAVDKEIQRAAEDADAASLRVSAASAQVRALRQKEIDAAPNELPLQQARQEITQLLTLKEKADHALHGAEIFASNELAGVKGSPGNSGQAGDGPRRKAAMEALAGAKSRAEEAGRALEAARSRLDTLRKDMAAREEKNRQRSDDQLPLLEKAVEAETAQYEMHKEKLAALTRDREDAIRDRVVKAPDHVALDDGFLAQIVALEHIAEKDSKIAAVILLIDIVSFGFELAAVLAKVTSFVPTTYAALIARDAYLRAIHIADEITRELDISARQANVEAGMLQAHPTSLGGLASTLDSAPTKKPRGRPRKSPLE